MAPSTATPICRVPSTAACARSIPPRSSRAMFSTTTMESSTRSPSAITNPTMDSWLMLNPAACSSATASASDSGMDTITTSEARVPSGSSVSSTSPMAMAKSHPSRDSRASTLRAWSNPRASVTPGGSDGTTASSARHTASRTADTLVPDCAVTLTHMARWPLKRARCTASPSPHATSATSRTRTTPAGPAPTTVRATSSGER